MNVKRARLPIGTHRGMASWSAAGTARPSSPVSVFAEDFSLLIRTPRRMRIARSHIRVLS